MALDFDAGTLILTEAGTKRQASLHVVQGREALARHNPGGLEVLNIDLATFVEALAPGESHAQARAHRSAPVQRHRQRILRRDSARCATVALQADSGPDQRGSGAPVRRDSIGAVAWIDRLQSETGSEFPEKVTAFREGMAVHGRYGKPCPVCGSPVQRIVYAANETNYCARCQTGGRLLADRSLSRLLRDDWPRTLEELERRRGR